VTAADGSKTVGPLAAVTALNAHYINKIDVIRDKLASALPPTPSTWPRKTAQYSHSFTSAGRITRIVRKLGTTEANGTDGIPVSILKKGIVPWLAR
jgi:hypothetical protein